MRNYKYKVIICVFSIFLFFSCTSKVNTTHIDLTILQSFGDNTDALFGSIADFCMDKRGNVYVLDDALKEIKKFSPNGKLVMKIGHGLGKGPGEFLLPRSIDIDTLGNIYVMDLLLKRISVFNSSNKLLKEFTVKYMPGRILVIKPFEIFILRFPLGYTGNLIYKYKLNRKNYEQPILTLCKPYSGKDSLIINRTGNTGRLVNDDEVNLYYSFFYPYEIRKFSNSGHLLVSIKNKNEIFEQPYTKGELVSSPEGSKFLFIYHHNHLINVYFRGGNKQRMFVADLYKNDKYISRIQIDSLHYNNIKEIKSNGDDILLISFMSPYPRLVKYLIKGDVK